MSLEADLGGLATIRADHVQPKRVKWIWKGRIPAGKVTMLDGDPGFGKSTITTDLTARVTTAKPFPDGDQMEKRRCVLLLSAEDSADDTIVPRLKVAGADLRLVTILDHVVDDGGPRQVELPADIDRIEKWCASLIYSDTLDEDSAWTTPGLVVIDPLMAFLGGEVNAHRDQDVRRVLYRLKVMAEETGCAVVCVRHLNKMPGTNPLYRGGGSIGIIGAARAGLLVGADPDDNTRSIMAVSKSNLGPKAPSLAYQIVGASFRHGDDQVGASRVVWKGTSDHTAEDLLGHPVERAAPKQEEAGELLRSLLKDGAKPRAAIQKVAKVKKVSWRTIERAKAELEVIVERRGEPGKRGGGSYWWRLPDGQLQIKSATANTTPVGGQNEVDEAAGQSTDSDPTAINSATPPDDGGPKRLQLRRTPGWRLPDGAVKVARPTRWGNPHQATERTHQAHAEAVARYRQHLADHPELAEVAGRELRGKDLACWCSPWLPCHADVLLEVANA